MGVIVLTFCILQPPVSISASVAIRFRSKEPQHVSALADKTILLRPHVWRDQFAVITATLRGVMVSFCGRHDAIFSVINVRTSACP